VSAVWEGDALQRRKKEPCREPGRRVGNGARLLLLPSM
jgi:hypothetical protein